MSRNRSNATAPAVKGDVSVGTGTDTSAVLAVGNNGEILVADSSTATGLAYKPLDAAGKNIIINGGMDIWQRGTTSASITTSQVYTADRWLAVSGASTGTVVSRQTTSDTTNLPTIQYCARVARTAGQTGTSLIQFAQSMESVNSVRFAGQSVVLSFYARRGANYSSASNALNVLMLTGTGTDQQVLTGYTGSVSAINSFATLTTTWQRFTFTATLATNINEIGLDFYYTPSGTAGANDYFEITGVQLELGSTATTFSRAGGTIQGELAACQRYYWRIANTDAYAVYGLGIGESTTALGAAIQMPVPMRVKPTSVDYSSVQFSDTITSPVPTSLSINAFKSSNFIAYINGGGLTGITQYRVYELRNNNSTSGYVGLSAEL